MTRYTCTFDGTAPLDGRPSVPISVAVTVEADDPDTAEARARLAAYRRWTADGLAARADGAMPDLALRAVSRLGWIAARTATDGAGPYRLD